MSGIIGGMTECKGFDMTEPTKICSKCNIVYLRSNEFFNRNSASPDGLRPDCKTCQRNRVKQSYANNPTKMMQYQKKYRLENPEKIRQSKKQEYQKNKKRYLANSKKRYINNPESFKNEARKRRARIRDSFPDSITTQEVLERWGTDCHICGKPIDLSAPRKCGVDGWEIGLHLDHDIPLYKGGRHILDNVKPAHGLCNLQKH